MKYLVHALRRHPVLLADLLAFQNRCSRLQHELRVSLTLLFAATLGVLMALAIAISFRASLVRGVSWMMAHGAWVGAMVALYAGMLVTRRRIAVERQRTLSWLLAAVPIATFSSAVAWRTLWPLGVQFVLLAACVLSAVLLQPASLSSVLPLLAWMVSGTVAGAIAGWWLGGLRRESAIRRYENSRYAPFAIRGVALPGTASPQPSMRALSSLPIARAMAWHRPVHSRVFLLALILLMPAGIAMPIVGCVALIGLLMSYAAALARAVLQTASEAARWLRATPIRFVAFAWPIMRRAVLHQVVLTVSIAALLLPLGATLAAVSYLALLWLALVTMTWTIWLRGCFCNERALLNVMASAGVTLGVEQLVRGSGIGCALLWTAWNFRRRTA